MDGQYGVTTHTWRHVSLVVLKRTFWKQPGVSMHEETITGTDEKKKKNEAPFSSLSLYLSILSFILWKTNCFENV